MLDRKNLDKYIFEEYGCIADHPWEKHQSDAVYRHKHNRKWFALVMDLPKKRLGLQGDEIIEVMNIKCDFILIGSLLQQKGFYPAYHMNKSNWISIVLDGSVDDDTVKTLLQMSYDATKK